MFLCCFTGGAGHCLESIKVKTKNVSKNTHFTSCHPPSVKKGFVKGEALRILRTNSSKTTFEENISNFKKRLIDRGYPQTMVENLLSDIKFTERESHETQQQRGKRNIAFRDTVPALSVCFNEKKKRNLIQNQPLLHQISKNHLSFPTRKENP